MKAHVGVCLLKEYRRAVSYTVWEWGKIFLLIWTSFNDIGYASMLSTQHHARLAGCSHRSCLRNSYFIRTEWRALIVFFFFFPRVILCFFFTLSYPLPPPGLHSSCPYIAL